MSTPTLPLTESARQLLTFVIVFTVVVTLIVGLRFYAALVLAKRRIRIDDWLMLLAWISTIINTSLVIWGVPHGVGAHSHQLPISQKGDRIRIQFKNLNFITWLIATCSTKASVLFFYMVIFTTNVRFFKITLYALLGVCAGFFVAYFCMVMTACVPFDHPWNPQPGGYCRGTTVQEIVSVCINIVLDLCIIMMPLPTLWRLQLHLKNKLIISFLLGIGIINTAIMCSRLAVTLQTRNAFDKSYGFGNGLLLAELEIWVGISAACVPTLTPLWAAWILPLANTVIPGVGSRSGNSKGGVTDAPSNRRSLPVPVTASSSGGNQNSPPHANKGGAGDTLITNMDAFCEPEDGYMLRGETNKYTLNVRGGGGAGGDESSTSGSLGGVKEQRRSQDIQVRQEVLVTYTMGQKANDRASKECSSLWR